MKESTEDAIKSHSPHLIISTIRCRGRYDVIVVTALSSIPHSSCLSSLSELSPFVSDYQYKNAGRILHDKSGGKGGLGAK